MIESNLVQKYKKVKVMSFKNPFKKEDRLNEPINAIPVSNFLCRYCESADLNQGNHPKYFENNTRLKDHIIAYHPEEWPKQLHSAEMARWLNPKVHNTQYSNKELKAIYNAYIKVRATPDVGLSVMITDKQAMWHERATSRVEKLLYTHARALNYAMKISGRTDKAVRSVLNGKHGRGGQALISRSQRNTKSEGSWEITRLSLEALKEVQSMRDKLGLAGYANSPQLLELTKAKPDHTEFSAENFADLEALVQESRKPEVTIPTAVVDVPENSTGPSNFAELLDELNKTPEMDWSTFSSTLGTSVFQEYLELTDDNKRLIAANHTLSQQVEILLKESHNLNQQLEFLCQKLETQSTKPTVMAGIAGAGIHDIQQILKNRKPGG